MGPSGPAGAIAQWGERWLRKPAGQTSIFSILQVE